ncbi:tRNA 2-thiouridine(34) synthase MnmA [Treponema rectale]|uniref:tRNA-specific 2-thiouridylase MnmA n=1 Tax=Treponema rectale TaxID=744512 RepID=A0A7M1XKF6_9SPIR|nr:tRNA 2-thiouridine(34) synthase MnmA [Treponema rectale]
MSKKVLLGLSGGVDSAVSAYLLKKQGYEVTCCFMRNWDSITNNDIEGNPTLSGSKCSQEFDYDDAVETAFELELPIIRKDFIDEYWKEVFQQFLDTYKKGYTPDPDVFCNKYIKFGHFYQYAKSLGFDTIAMGHYAMRIDEDHESHLYKAFDKNKDQSYFLAQISSEQLSHCLFPLENLTKPQVREIAQQEGLSAVMHKKDSTGVCFIGERNFKQFLHNYLPSKPGDIIDITNNQVLKKHDGVLYYTVGQHRGLDIGGIKGRKMDPYFVVGKDVEKNVLYVAQEEGNTYRKSYRCMIDHLNWIGMDMPLETTELNCKFRYRGKDMPVKFTPRPDYESAYLDYDGYDYIAKGQIAVLYLGDRCLGSGIIEETFDQNLEKILY